MNIFVINLDKRPERWSVTEDHLEKIGMSGTRFAGIDSGWQGCRDSHLQVMEENKRGDPFMILEDDVYFLQEKPWYLIETAMEQLPPIWDILFLGISPQEPLRRYSNNLFRVNKRAFCLHAYIINNKNGVIDYILKHRHEINKIDLFMSEMIYPYFNCFVTYPMVATQRVTGTSDTCKRSDTTTIVENYKRFCK